MSSHITPEQRSTIARQLTWRVSLLSLIALLVLPGVALLGWQVTMRNAQARLQTTRAKAFEAFEEFLWRAADDLWSTADALGAGGEADPLFRRTLARQEGGFFELLWVREDGRIRASRRWDATSPPGALPSQPWKETTARGELYIGALDYVAGGLPLLDMAVPVRDEAQTLTGVLVARVDLTSLWNTVKAASEGWTGSVYVTDVTGKVLLHRESALMEQRAAILSPSDLGRLIVGSFMPVYTQVAGKSMVIVGGLLKGAPWYVVVQQPTLDVIAPFLQQLVFLSGLTASIVLLVFSTARFTRQEIVMPLHALRTGVFTLEHDLTYRIKTAAKGELAALTNTLNSLATQLDQTINTLERRVDERTRGLLAAAEVSRSTTSVLDPEALLWQTVNLVRDRFELYYVGLFLLDEAEEYLILRAGSGDAGQQMAAAGYRCPVGDSAIIARCVATTRAHIALDVGEEAQSFDNPLLPRTRSEMALPLRSQRRVIGAMTVQSEREAAFDETNILVMQTMADQVAVAIDNARLYARTQQALQEMELLQQRYLGEAWGEFLRQRPLWGYRRTREGLTPLGKEPLAGVRQALAQRETLITDPAETSTGSTQVIVPVRFRDQLLGALGFTTAEGAALSDEQIAFVEAVAEQFGLAAENLRLVETTQRLAAREHVVGEISARMRESLDLDTILRAAAEQIRLTMQTPEVTIRLRMAEVDHEKRA